MTCPRNPSEIGRLYEELYYYRGKLKTGSRTKQEKEEILREIRKLEDTLEIEHDDYN